MNWMLSKMVDQKKEARFTLKEIQKILDKTGRKALVGLEPEKPDPTQPPGFVSWKFLLRINLLDFYDRIKKFLKKTK